MITWTRRHARLAASSIAGTVAMVATLLPVAPAVAATGYEVVRPYTVARASVGATGGEAADESRHASLSDDGRLLAFEAATAFDDEPGHLWIRDLEGGIEPVTTFIADHGEYAPVFGLRPVLAGDGTALAYATVEAPTDGEIDAASIDGPASAEQLVQVWDTATRDVTTVATPVPVYMLGTVAIDDAGGRVVFAGDVQDPASGSLPDWRIFAADVGEPAVEIGDGGDAEGPPGAALSGDGSRALWHRFDTSAGTWSLLGRDLPADLGSAPASEALGDVDAAGDANGWYGDPAVSDDGSVVVTAVDGDLGYELQRWAGGTTTTLAPFAGHDATVTAGMEPAVSDDGDVVVFQAVPMGGTSFQVFAWDEGDATLAVVSTTADGADGSCGDGGCPGGIDVDGPVVDATGDVVAFTSAYGDLVADDTNGVLDVFVADRRELSAPPAWPSGAGVRVGGTTEGTVTLEWDAATDDVAVTGYRILLLGGSVPLGTTEAGVRTFTTPDVFEPGSTLTFLVQAVDGDGQASPALTVEATTAGSPGGARPLEQLSLGHHADGGAGLSWPATTDAGITGWQVVRIVGDDEVVLDDLPLATTTYRDASGLAGASYEYRIDARTGTGTEAYTWAEPYTFAALTAWNGSWGVGDAQPALLAPGDVLRFTVDATAGRIGTARIVHRTYDEGSPADVGAPAEAEVVLTETTPGRYEATWTLPERTALVASVQLAVSDGVSEATNTPFGFPRTVGSPLTVTTTGDPGAIAGAQLYVTDQGTWQGSFHTLRAGTTHELGVVAPGQDVSISLYGADGDQLAVLHDQQIHAGAPATFALEPRFRASVVVDVVDDEGNPVRGAWVVARDAAGDYLAGGDTFGGPATLTGLRQGETYTLAVERPRGPLLQQSVEETVTLADVGENHRTVVLPRLVTAVLQGTVSRTGGDDGGGPIRDASVTVTQSIDGTFHSATATTDDEGEYALEALVGAAVVSVTAYGEPASVTNVTVPAEGLDHDVTWERPVPYTFDISLSTQYAGAAVFPVELDWRSAVHYRLHVSSGSGYHSVRSGTYHYRGRPGETVKVCASGHEGGLPAVCETAVLPVDPTAPLPFDLLLAQSGGVEGTLLRDGSPVRWRQGDLYELTAEGERWLARTETDGAGGFRFDVPDDGDYLVQFRHDGRTVRRTIAGFSAGESVDLGTLVLEPADGDTFAGAGNSVAASRRSVFAGGLVEFRTAFRAGRAVAGAEARLQVPAGATVPADAVTLDGTVVATTAVDDILVVDLGDLAAGDGGTLRLAVRVPADAVAGSLVTSTSRISYGADGDEEVGAGTVEIGGVTLDAPDRTASRALTLSGRAPAGATVELLAGRSTLATTQAGPGGYWRKAVTLPELGGTGVYRLQARVGDDADADVSRVASVRYDGRAPVLEEVVVEQQDGRRVSFDPREGVARFPYVFVPGMPTTVSLGFDRPDAVENVRIRILEKEVAAALEDDGYHRGVITDQRFGKIAVAYDVKPASFDPGAAPDEDQLRRRLPAGMAQFEIATLDPDRNVEGSGAGELSVDLGDGSSLAVEVDVQSTSYQPTAEERARAAATGVPAYGTTLEYEGDGTTPVDGDGALEATITTYVECAALPAGSCDDITGAVEAAGFGAASVRTKEAFGAASFRTAAAVGAVAKVITKVRNINSGADEAGLNAWNTLTNKYAADQSWGAGDKYDKVGQLYDMLAGCPPEVNTTGFRNRIDRALEKAGAADVASAGLALAGLVLGGPLGAVGAFVLTEAASQAVGFALGAELDLLRNDIAAACPPDDDDDDDDDDEWDDDDEDDDWGPLADPTAIYDPSGYVYEGLESNRLQGVTATVLRSPTPDGPWEVWDAEWFGQENPLITDAEGRYGWDVPEDYWQVVWTKDGYETGYSEVLKVLPPHFDVNEGLVSLSPPTVASLTATTGALDVTFSQPMVVPSLAVDGRVAVTVDGVPVEGTVAAVGAEEAPDGRSLASTFRFTPTTAFASGAVLDVTVDAAVQSYALRGLAADHTGTATVPAPPVTGGGGGSGGGAGGGGAVRETITIPARPGAPTEVAVSTPAGTVRFVLHGAQAGQLTVEVVSRPVTVPGVKALATSFELSSSGTFDAAEVCFPYRDAEVAAAGATEDRLALFHGVGGGFTDITTAVAPGRNEVCGTTTSFSPFVLGTTRSARLAGTDRYATAAAISASAFPAGAPVAVLASGASHADALAAGPVAARLGGPVLLTAADRLPAPTIAELERLRPSRIIVAGGSAAVGDGVLAQLRGITGTDVERAGGADRYATASALLGLAAADTGVVYLAAGASFADALAGGVLAGSRGAGLLLTEGGRLPAATADALRRLRPGRIVALGGTAAVGEGVLEAAASAAGGAVTARLAGIDRYATAAAVAAEIGSRSVFVATGSSFPDALAAVPAAVRSGSALVLVQPGAVPASTMGALRSLGPSSVTVVGGTGAVDRRTEHAVAATMP